MNKTIKILSILAIAITLVTFMSSNVFASTTFTPGDIIDKVEDQADKNSTVGTDSKLMTSVGKIIAMLRNVSVIAAVVVLIIMGVKYIMGSVEQKADYQKSFIPLIVGIVLVVGATSIASFLFSLV